VRTVFHFVDVYVGRSFLYPEAVLTWIQSVP